MAGGRRKSVTPRTMLNQKNQLQVPGQKLPPGKHNRVKPIAAGSGSKPSFIQAKPPKYPGYNEANSAS